uniref:Uncharacterized protein n=1 Tax=Electrophorus electricus TaxID=8005 RepID=A0A4W4DSD3_ELEEL
MTPPPQTTLTPYTHGIWDRTFKTDRSLNAAKKYMGYLHEILCEQKVSELFYSNSYTGYGSEGQQFAVAINVKAEQCSTNDLDQNFLDQYPSDVVKNNLAGVNKVFIGDRLIAARPKPIPGSNNNYHSEYLLLINSTLPNQEVPPIWHLLNTDNNGCVVFYTYNSPCVKTCSTPNNCYSIIPALDMIKVHSGPKAFVFWQVWQHDNNSIKWKENIKSINDKVPLYHCDATQCTLCVNKNNRIEKKCVAQKNQN